MAEQLSQMSSLFAEYSSRHTTIESGEARGLDRQLSSECPQILECLPNTHSLIEIMCDKLLRGPRRQLFLEDKQIQECFEKARTLIKTMCKEILKQSQQQIQEEKTNDMGQQLQREKINNIYLQCFFKEIDYNDAKKQIGKVIAPLSITGEFNEHQRQLQWSFTLLRRILKSKIIGILQEGFENKTDDYTPFEIDMIIALLPKDMDNNIVEGVPQTSFSALRPETIQANHYTAGTGMEEETEEQMEEETKEQVQEQIKTEDKNLQSLIDILKSNVDKPSEKVNENLLKEYLLVREMYSYYDKNSTCSKQIEGIFMIEFLDETGENSVYFKRLEDVVYALCKRAQAKSLSAATGASYNTLCLYQQKINERLGEYIKLSNQRTLNQTIKDIKSKTPISRLHSCFSTLFAGGQGKERNDNPQEESTGFNLS